MTCKFGYFWNEKLAERNTGFLCPESSQRVRVLTPGNVLSCPEKVLTFGFQKRDDSLLRLVHQPAYIEHVQKAFFKGRRYLDAGDTRVTADVFDQALLSASAGCCALDEMFCGGLTTAFCVTRPPGHHANRLRALGFCVFNNVAIAARYSQTTFGIDRVLIRDWDVHPGNGTQEIFWEDSTVATLSFHQADHFSESGRSDLLGEGDGKGFNRNIPIPPGTDSPTYLQTFDRVLEEVTGRFRPELVVIAAGFDAHRRDPASSLNLTETDFGSMTKSVLRITRSFTGGKTLSLLEGGYNTHSLRLGVIEHCEVLASPSPHLDSDRGPLASSWRQETGSS